LAGAARFEALFTPSPTQALGDFACTRHRVVVTILDDVRSSLLVGTPPADDAGSWRVERADGPDVWTATCWPVDATERDDVFVTGSDFLTPERLDVVSLATGDGRDGGAERAPSPLRQAPARFDVDGLRIEQRFATSLDGTRVPFFLIGSDEALATTDGSVPTWLTAYGGFEVPRLAAYSAAVGRSWLADGGVYVLANIRGGGEYGPDWHRAGLRERRPRVYEDLEAVARELHASGITSRPRLGVSGGSNGGLLVGNMYVRLPELFGAVVCQVPLLDMQRYHLLLAGASWMAEYGDPDDPDDWAFLRTYSPYHLVEELADDVDTPPILITTSTRDDRVHPGHARKMAAKLEAAGRDVTYWENVEGGHGGAADAAQQATMQALIVTFLRNRLGLSG
ncbi:MAG: prolyl oligopeptidase family serine peptidase, partial [Actinomycetota bacterium]